MKRRRLLRLGLFQLAAGAASVLFLGVLNRVMRVELGIDLFAVSLLVGGGHYLGALVAIPFGYYSDTHRIAGYRRTVYALGGAGLTALILALSPFVAAWLARNQTPFGLLFGFLFFLLEGISTFIAGTAYLSLITDLTSEKERGQATALVWTLLMIGIIATGIGAGIALENYSFTGFAALTLTGALVTVTLSAAALFGQEPRQEPRAAPVRAVTPPGLGQSLRLIVRSAQSRWFAGFLLLSMFSFFMQDVILEPFGGEVFNLNPAQTARFNAYLGVGVILGMLLGGMQLIPLR
jgi:BCD family chlorophyll transporter-like MFS transporter